MNETMPAELKQEVDKYVCVHAHTHTHTHNNNKRPHLCTQAHATHASEIPEAQGLKQAVAKTNQTNAG